MCYALGLFGSRKWACGRMDFTWYQQILNFWNAVVQSLKCKQNHSEWFDVKWFNGGKCTNLHFFTVVVIETRYHTVYYTNIDILFTIQSWALYHKWNFKICLAKSYSPRLPKTQASGITFITTTVNRSDSVEWIISHQLTLNDFIYTITISSCNIKKKKKNSIDSPFN